MANILTPVSTCIRSSSRIFLNANKTFRNGVQENYHNDITHLESCNKMIDLRSDTITKPTTKMRQAMADAEVGDDVFGEDPTINELQVKMAKMFGMEKTLFVPTGTMGNLISILAHCNERGLEVLLGDRSHIYLYEQGGISHLGGVHPRTVRNNSDGTFDLEEMVSYIRPRDDPHQPYTQLVCVENTHNFCGGRVIPLQFLKKVRDIACEYDLNFHMDGARMMNAAVALGVSPAEVLQDVDSVSLCFSKGLGAPVGSIVGGTEAFIAKALRLRKALGGGMRQAGVIAAAALTAMEDATERLALDHKHAKIIAEEINSAGRDVVQVDLDGVDSNLIMVNIVKNGLTAADFCKRLAQIKDGEESTTNGVIVLVRPARLSNQRLRLYTHSSVDKEDLDLAMKKWRLVCEEYRNER